MHNLQTAKFGKEAFPDPAQKSVERRLFCKQFARELQQCRRQITWLLKVESIDLASSLELCLSILCNKLPDHQISAANPESTGLAEGRRSVLVVAVRTWTAAANDWVLQKAALGTNLLLLFGHGATVPPALGNLVNRCMRTPSLKFNLRPELAIHRFLTIAAPPGTAGALPKATEEANSGLARLENDSIQCVFCEWTGKDANLHQVQSPECPVWSDQGPPGDVLVPKECLNFKIEAHRLLSFWKASTVLSFPVSISELAANGFYYEGPEDKVVCAFCRLQVQGWEPNDRAHSEHQRWNPNCIFINGNARNNVKLGMEPTAVSTDGVTRRNHPYGPNVSFFDPSVRRRGGATGIHPALQVKHKEMMAHATRLATFQDWPPSMAQRPEELAASGFFYSGVGDRVVCFFCGLGLKDWDRMDSVHGEHEKWAPDCTSVKGDWPPAAVAATFSNSAARIGCFKCGSAPVDTVSLPCGHMGRCSKCVQPAYCDICNSRIVGAVHVFM